MTSRLSRRPADPRRMRGYESPVRRVQRSRHRATGSCPPRRLRGAGGVDGRFDGDDAGRRSRRCPAAGRPACGPATADDAVRLVRDVQGQSLARRRARVSSARPVSLATSERRGQAGRLPTTPTAVRRPKRRLSDDPSVGAVSDQPPPRAAHWIPRTSRLGRRVGPRQHGPDIEGIRGRAPTSTSTAAGARSGFGGTGVVVAVIDDGVDFAIPTSPARPGSTRAKSGAARRRTASTTMHNGYIDDVNGWDFCHDDKTVHDPDDDFHGTHVAGRSRRSSTGTGIVGVAPGVQDHGPQVHRRRPDCGSDDQAIEAIDYAAVVRRADSNNSVVGAAPDPSDRAGLAIEDSGMLFVAAAGNSGQDLDAVGPAAHPGVVRPAQHPERRRGRQHGKLASFSNYGETRSTWPRPGTNILSTYPGSTGLHRLLRMLAGPRWPRPHVSGDRGPRRSAGADPARRHRPISRRGSSTRPRTCRDRAARPSPVAWQTRSRAIDVAEPTASAPNGYAFVTGVSDRSTIKTPCRWPAAYGRSAAGSPRYALRQAVNSPAGRRVTASTDEPSIDRCAHARDRYRSRPGSRLGRQHRRDRRRPARSAEAARRTARPATYGGTWSADASLVGARAAAAHTRQRPAHRCRSAFTGRPSPSSPRRAPAAAARRSTSTGRT